nr:hypothetical protein HK105_003598 [Polyrhizophydium stewartii]
MDPAATPAARLVQLAVHPGKGLGRLALGLPLPAVIAYIKREAAVFRKYELKFGDQSPFDHPIVLNLLHNGIALRFDPVSQRLGSIEIYDFDKMSLSYGGSLFNSPAIVATFLLVYKTFGPTFPGEYEQDKFRYTLKYPGICFVFSIPAAFTPLQNTSDLPISFPDGSTPVVERIFIYCGDSLASATVPSLGPSDLYNELVLVHVGSPWFMASFISGCMLTEIALGATCQDVLAEIGPPEDVVGKRRDKMGIHRIAATQDFSMGVDLVFDATYHRVRKIILHTNMLAHHDVNLYARCNFDILPPPSPKSQAPSPASISCTSKWDEIQSILGKPLGPPVIFKRDPNHNPFGSTSYYGFNGLIFEIMKNGHIASLTLF